MWLFLWNPGPVPRERQGAEASAEYLAPGFPRGTSVIEQGVHHTPTCIRIV